MSFADIENIGSLGQKAREGKLQLMIYKEERLQLPMSIYDQC